MTDQACMRWSPGRIQSWQLPGRSGFNPSLYGVRELPTADAKAYVLDRHYSGSYPAEVLAYGLWELSRAALVGAAILSNPQCGPVLTNVFPTLEPYAESLELGRFVLDDEVPANAESWFLAEAFRLAAKAGIRGVVSFSDPMPRYMPNGTMTMPGHIGTIYQATNAIYTGRGTPRTHHVMPDGTFFSPRAMSKIRQQAKGHEYAERKLVSYGAPVMRAGELPAAWLNKALATVGHTVRHHGDHRYAFPIGTTKRARKAVRVALPGQPYPKVRDAA